MKKLFFVLMVTIIFATACGAPMATSTPPPDYVPEGSRLVDITPDQNGWIKSGEEYIAGFHEYAYRPEGTKVKIDNRERLVVYPIDDAGWIGTVDLGMPNCGFGPILSGTLMYEAKHANGPLYQLTGNTKLAQKGEYCESGLPYNINDVDGSFLGAYSYGFVLGSAGHEPDTIWIVGHK